MMREGFFKRFLVALVPIWVGVQLMGWSTTVKMQREAVEAGAAEWRIDATTGEKSFHYLKQGEAKDAVQE